MVDYQLSLLVIPHHAHEHLRRRRGEDEDRGREGCQVERGFIVSGALIKVMYTTLYVGHSGLTQGVEAR